MPKDRLNPVMSFISLPVPHLLPFAEVDLLRGDPVLSLNPFQNTQKKQRVKGRPTSEILSDIFHFRLNRIKYNDHTYERVHRPARSYTGQIWRRVDWQRTTKTIFNKVVIVKYGLRREKSVKKNHEEFRELLGHVTHFLPEHQIVCCQSQVLAIKKQQYANDEEQQWHNSVIHLDDISRDAKHTALLQYSFIYFCSQENFPNFWFSFCWGGVLGGRPRLRLVLNDRNCDNIHFDLEILWAQQQAWPQNWLNSAHLHPIVKWV